MSSVRRVAILGGGMASLAAAVELTNDPTWASRYEITVYQMGWRLGGKGASARNLAASGRIEEHGLHVWFGCYDHAFRLLRGCYDELRRPTSSPFPTLESAFHPMNVTPYFEEVDGAWTTWPVWFPPNPDKPGTGGPDPSTWDYLVMALEAIVRGAEGLLHLAGPPAPSASSGGLPHWLASHLPHPLTGGEDATLAAALDLAKAMPRDPSAQTAVHHSGLLWLLEASKDWLIGHLAKEATAHPVLRRSIIELDLGLTTVIGCLRDGVHRDGFEVIDGEDTRAWFLRHGAQPTSVDSTPIRALYDLYFAYDGGDIGHPSFSAGVAIGAVLRLALGYKGAVVNEMRAGMGEIVIAPIYEVLAKRGVRFAFFHRVEQLAVSADRSRIERIELARQVDLVDGTPTGYRPLIDVDGLPCWPAVPNVEQIRDGGALKDVDLESRWSGWTDVGRTTLTADVDFDAAILGISLAGIPDIAPDFRADPRWADLLDHVGTTQTVAAQLWMDASLEDLGWTGGPVPTDAAPEPLDVWADRSETLPLERWPSPAPTTVQYLCGPMPGRAFERPPTDRGVPGEAKAAVEATVTTWLGDGGIGIWPGLRAPDGGVDWSRFHARSDSVGPARLAAQYLRANIDPSERYVLSLPGTARYRLGADESGFANLALAGDWTRTSWNVGCIEAAVLSGIAAARVISGPPVPSATSSSRGAATPASPSPAPGPSAG